MSSTAAILSLATGDRVRAEAAAWTRFAAARDGAEFAASWLAILCSQIGTTDAAVLLLGKDGDFAPTAFWPDPARDVRYLTAAAQRALTERRGVVLAPDGSLQVGRDSHAFIGYPIEIGGVLHGAVVLDLAPAPDRDLQRALRLLHWGTAPLLDRLRQRSMAEHEAKHARTGLVMDLLATALATRRLKAACTAVTAELARRLDCARVSIGLDHDKWVEVQAISDTAVFDPKMALVRHIAAAMEEMLDLDAMVVFPPQAAGDGGAASHAELARAFNSAAICTVPLLQDGQAVGAITLERDTGAPFGPADAELCQIAGTLLGPVLALKREAERGLWQRLRERARDGAVMLFGPRHPGAKLIAACLVAAVVALSLVTGTYRITAHAVLEGAVERAAVAPFDGHIAESFVRAGDLVHAGQVLARLDDRDLVLERGKLISEREQTDRKNRQALAMQDRAAMVIGAAQSRQLDAQIALLDDKLARVTLKAPFDGIVVSGDLSQLLGAPVETGKILFQVAPLDDYRVVLQADERDIADLHKGQHGELSLSGLPFQHLVFQVKQITPVATVQDGRNFFRVEAQLDTAPDQIRPGMEGVAKVDVGSRKLIWIWTHSLVDWVRNWAWRDLP
jgi:multidrug resistance efflux pump